MKGHNFFHQVVAGLAIPPQSIANATVNGTAIVEPWSKGRQLVFHLLGGAFAASADGLCKVQVQKRSDSSWVDWLNAAGTLVQFPAAKLDDAGELENGELLGTIPLTDVDSGTYKAMRLVFIAQHATATQLIAAGYLIFDLRSEPSGQVDELFAIAHVPVP